MSETPAARPKRRTFPGRADQIAHARDFTRRALGPCPVLDEAVLLVSELATNALEHTATSNAGSFHVTICLSETSVLVAVTDDGSDETPLPRPVDALAEDGRGLGLVDSVADRWGQRGNQHSRTVWAELHWKRSELTSARYQDRSSGGHSMAGCGVGSSSLVTVADSSRQLPRAAARTCPPTGSAGRDHHW
jgi:anti-sigma regulatory factor (Ser/Thr protein kinase)